MGKSWKRLVQRQRRAASEVEAAPVTEQTPAPAPAAEASPAVAPAPKKVARKAQSKTSKKSK